MFVCLSETFNDIKKSDFFLYDAKDNLKIIRMHLYPLNPYHIILNFIYI